MKSIIYDQLDGKSDADVEDCSDNTTNAEMGKTISVTGKPLNPNDTAIPCGIASKTIFNDNFELFTKVNNQKIQISD